MADYVITKVRYNRDESRIDELLVNDEGTTTTRVEQRATVISKIPGKTYRTQPPSGGLGANVQVVDVNGAKFLRTDANKTAKDNLGNLPKF